MTRRRTENPDPAHIFIVAGRTSPPTCLVTWNAREIVMPCDQVRQVAGDMLAAAARAEAEAIAAAVLRETLGSPDTVAAGFLGDMRRRYTPRVLGIKDVLTLVPGVSILDGSPFVHANVAPYEPLRFPPAALRSMALAWLTAAESAERDAILGYVLADVANLTTAQLDQVFAAMRDVRPDNEVRG